MRCKRLSAPSDDFEEYVRKLSALSRQPAVQAFEDTVELHLLDVLRRVDAKSGHAEPGEAEQVVGDLLADGGEPGVQIGQRQQLAVLDVGGALVVGDGARRMEVGGGIQAGVLVL